MKFISHILSYLFIFLFVVKSALFSVVTYLYTNNNDELTALCCVNKTTDPDCNAKCFVEKTKQTTEEKEHKNMAKSIDFFQSLEITAHVQNKLSTTRKDNFHYLLTTLSVEQLQQIKPPTV